jgi:hypothetical protein
MLASSPSQVHDPIGYPTNVHPFPNLRIQFGISRAAVQISERAVAFWDPSPFGNLDVRALLARGRMVTKVYESSCEAAERYAPGLPHGHNSTALLAYV